MRLKTLLAAGAAALTVTGAACSHSRDSAAETSTVGSSTTVGSITTVGSSTTVGSTAIVPPTSAPGAVDPNAPELVEPGDIPDNQAFVVYTSTSGVFSIKVPEGWARTEQNAAVTFTDKYNSVSVQSAPATSAPTVASVRAGGLADVSTDPTFTLVDVKPASRKAGDGVLATFEIGSAPNEVTGKKALLAVERYVFFHAGTLVTLTLSGAKGADNVDPWKIVSDSLTWI